MEREMLTAEIKVNGCLIGHLYVVKVGPLPDEYRDLYEYDYSYHEIGSEIVTNGKLPHYRSNGALALVRLCAEQLKKRGCKTEWA